MNKEFLKDMYDVVSSKGYPDDFSTFVSKIQTDPSFQQDLYTTVKDQGYPDTFRDFSTLIGAKPIYQRTSLQEIESMRSDVHPPLLEEERTPDAPPFLTRTPRTSEIIAESRPEGKEGPIARQRRIDDANAAMMAEIEGKKNKASSYGGTGILRNPAGNFALSLVAPAVAEAYKNDRMPDLGDAAIDVGLTLATLYATPARAATTLNALAKLSGGAIERNAPKLIAPLYTKLGGTGVVGKTVQAVDNVKRDVILSAGIASGSELAQSYKNEREYDPYTTALSGVAGGVLGGASRLYQLNKLRKMGFTDDEIPSILRKIGTSEASTLRNIRSNVPTDIRSVGMQTFEEPMMFGGSGTVTQELEAPENTLQDIAERFNYYMMDKRLNGELPMSKYKEKVKEFDKFKEAIDNITEMDLANKQRGRDLIKSYSKEAGLKAPKLRPLKSELTYPKILSELADVEDPDVCRAISDVLDPVLGKDDGSTSDIFNSLQTANKYKAASEALQSPLKAGNVFELAQNILTKSSPQALEATRVLTAPTVMNATKQTKKEVKKPAKSNITNNPLYDSEGNVVYAPRGRITWEELMAD